MVYESDFYTTRRPYSSSRPYVSSYNVTPLYGYGSFYLYYPYRNYLRTIPHMPYIAHRKLVTITHMPVHIYHVGAYQPIKLHARVRPSIIAAELNRIRYLYRPSTHSYTEKYLTSRDYLDFDDETRDIRAKTDNLLRKIHVFVPRPSVRFYSNLFSRFAYPYWRDYEETTPDRIRSDDYVRRIINAKNTRKEIESLPWYSTPAKRELGAGHLACIKYAGGRAQPRRRAYYTVGDLVPGDVKSDVHLMSYYMKNRKAAEDALKKQPDEETIKRVQEYIEKKAAEKKLEEERRAWEAAERKKLADEKELARLAQIKLEMDARKAEMMEQERLESERQALIQKAEEAKKEAERLVEDEKLLNTAIQQAIADEEERLIKEKEQEELKKKDEVEENNVVEAASEGLAANELVVDDTRSEEHSHHAELSDQDKEAKPYDVDNGDDTEIEEEEPELDNPFVESEGAASTHIVLDGEASASALPVVDEPVEESQPTVRQSGGEQGFDWSEYENESEASKTVVEAKEAQQAEELVSASGDNQVFEETEVTNEATAVEETQVEEVQTTEEAQVEEEQVEETQEETAIVEETQEEEVAPVEETQEEEAAPAEETQVEEMQEEVGSVHDMSEEEE